MFSIELYNRWFRCESDGHNILNFMQKIVVGWETIWMLELLFGVLI